MGISHRRVENLAKIQLASASRYGIKIQRGCSHATNADGAAALQVRYALTERYRYEDQPL